MFTPVNKQKPHRELESNTLIHHCNSSTQKKNDHKMLASGETGLSSGETRKRFQGRVIVNLILNMHECFSFPPLVPDGKMVRDISMFPISTRVKASCEGRHVVNDRDVVF